MNRPFLCLFLTLIITGAGSLPAGAGGLKLDNYQIDLLQWGLRTITVNVDNPRSDSARLDVKVMTLYPDHYLSGLKTLEVDTTIFIEPLAVRDIAVKFEMPGSFGRVISKAFFYWRYLHPWPNDSFAADSSSKTFSSVAIAKDEALTLSNRKHSIGPGYCKIDHPLLDFEFPRLMLFLLSRGSTLKKIEDLLLVEDGYTQYVYQQLRRDDFFPLPADTLAPGILALTEPELYTIRARTTQGTETFAAWYDQEGKAALDKLMKKAGLDDFCRELPGLQMKILLTLLEKDLVADASAFDISHFQNPDQDQKSQNRARWIVQGGDFFMPRLCLAEFQDKGIFHLSTFSPNPKLPYDVAPIYDMRKAIENPLVPIRQIKASQLRKIIDKATKEKLIDGVAADLKAIVEAARGDVAVMQPYQAPYLADYIYQTILGGYFVSKESPADWLDCVIIKY